MRIAYLLNQYPFVSCTFIRREIVALEAMGLDVVRYSIRNPEHDLVDPSDREEAGRTRYLLPGGIVPIVASVLATVVSRPLRFLVALREAVRVGQRSGRIGVHLAYLAEACVVLRWCRDAAVDHVHCHFATNPTTVALLSHRMGGPGYSFTVHGPHEYDQPEALGMPLKIERAKFVVAISSFGRSQLYRWCGHEHWPKIQIVHCGVDGGYLEAGPQPIVEAGPPRLVCLGRLCEQKGQVLLVEAARRLHEQGYAFELVLAGDGEMRGEVEALITRHGLGDRVTITGWASGNRVREELTRCRAMVLPSFAEGLPVAIMEAMAIGRPVITTSIAGIPELVTPDCGWVVTAGSIDALADAIRDCLDAPIGRLNQMGAVGAERVRQRHDARAEAAKLAEMFRDVRDGGGGR
jgi:colanic acid/amylovoran biosynthesis glycosyltransferase